MRNIVCIGASSGGLAAIEQLVRRLPANLPAAVFIVRHIAPDGTGFLSEIVQPICALPIAEAVDGESIANGRIYVAPPNRHLVLDRTKIVLVSGPKENWARPSVDALFRSAAQHHGPRSIGIILSGKLDDGTAGLWAMKRRGAFTVVQTPGTAAAPEMPTHALAAVDVDIVADPEEIGTLLPKWCRETTAYTIANSEDKLIEAENAYLLKGQESSSKLDEIGKGAGIICPDCGGQLWELKEGPLRYRCHVGHGYSAHSLLMRQAMHVESTAWRLVRTLEEDVQLCRRMLAAAGPESFRDRLENRIKSDLNTIATIRGLIADEILDSATRNGAELRETDRFSPEVSLMRNS